MRNNSIWIFIFITIFAGLAAGMIAANANGGGSPPDSSGSEDPPVPPDPPAQIYNVQIFVDSGSEPVEVYDGQDITGELLATVTYAGGPETVQCQSAYLYMTSSADTLNSETLNVTSNISIDYELNYGDDGYGEAWEALFSVEGDGTILGIRIEEYEVPTGYNVTIKSPPADEGGEQTGIKYRINGIEYWHYELNEIPYTFTDVISFNVYSDLSSSELGGATGSIPNKTWGSGWAWDSDITISEDSSCWVVDDL